MFYIVFLLQHAWLNEWIWSLSELDNELFVCLFVYLFICLFIYLFIYLSIYLSGVVGQRNV